MADTNTAHQHRAGGTDAGGTDGVLVTENGGEHSSSMVSAHPRPLPPPTGPRQRGIVRHFIDRLGRRNEIDDPRHTRQLDALALAGHLDLDVEADFADTCHALTTTHPLPHPAPSTVGAINEARDRLAAARDAGDTDEITRAENAVRRLKIDRRGGG